MFKDRDEKVHQRVMCQTDNDADPNQNYQSEQKLACVSNFLETELPELSSFKNPLSQAFLKLISSTFIHMECIASN